MTIYEMAVRQRVGSNDYFNVLHYDVAGAGEVDFQAFADNFAAQWALHLDDVIAPAISLEDITIRENIAGSVGVTYTPDIAPVVGTAADNQFAGQLACQLSKLTKTTTRPTLGRMYIPGVTSEGLNSFGEWTSTITDAVEAYGDAIMNVGAGTNVDADMVVVASNPAAPNTNAFNLVQELTAVAIPVTLQSRKKGRGA